MTQKLRESFWKHRYTLVPSSPATAADDWGNIGVTSGSAVTGKKCMYSPQERLRGDETGNVTIDIPTMVVPGDEAISVGDLVRNISALNPDGSLTALVAGTLAVDVVEPRAFSRGNVTKIVRLREGKVQ